MLIHKLAGARGLYYSLSEWGDGNVKLEEELMEGVVLTHTYAEVVANMSFHNAAENRVVSKIVYFYDVQSDISILKGIHPGFVVERELKRRGLKKIQFAQSLGEYPQTLVAILKGKRRMNTSLALKAEQTLGFEEGYLMTLQVFYDIKEEKHRSESQTQPELSAFRPALFWDTSIDTIDWQRQKTAIVRRIFERGNAEEKNAITNYYGKTVIDGILRGLSVKPR